MTQEDKQLLLVDLCGRLPYGVMVHFDGWNAEKLTQVDLREFIFNDMGGIPIPYLRPMSSMTEEEKEQWLWLTNDSGWGVTERMVKECIDFLNKNMFDFRGLIPKGRAISTEEFNPYK